MKYREKNIICPTPVVQEGSQHNSNKKWERSLPKKSPSLTEKKIFELQEGARHPRVGQLWLTVLKRLSFVRQEKISIHNLQDRGVNK